MAGHDAGFALGAGDDDHVDVVGHHQPVGRDELEMQIGHYLLAFNLRVERAGCRLELVAAARVAEADDLAPVERQGCPR